jgi:hypothetical protein
MNDAFKPQTATLNLMGSLAIALELFYATPTTSEDYRCVTRGRVCVFVFALFYGLLLLTRPYKPLSLSLSMKVMRTPQGQGKRRSFVNKEVKMLALNCLNPALAFSLLEKLTRSIILTSGAPDLGEIHLEQRTRKSSLTSFLFLRRQEHSRPWTRLHLSLARSLRFA